MLCLASYVNNLAMGSANGNNYFFSSLLAGYIIHFRDIALKYSAEKKNIDNLLLEYKWMYTFVSHHP